MYDSYANLDTLENSKKRYKFYLIDLRHWIQHISIQNVGL